jgi:hypothetical protein
LRGIEHAADPVRIVRHDLLEREPVHEREDEERGDVVERIRVGGGGKQVRERLPDGLHEARGERGDGRAQLGVGARGDGDLEPGVERRAGDHPPEEVDRRGRTRRSGRQASDRVDELGVSAVEEVADSGDHELRLRGEVVQLRTARHAGPLGDLGRGGAGVSQRGKALDRRVEELPAG